jgi:hypothetical protein
MICEIISFPARPGASREDVVADARLVAPRWRSERELVRKHFVLSEDGRTVKGIYFWTSRAAAQKAHDAEWQQGVKERSGAMPEIVYFDTFMIVDNEAGATTEYPPAEAAPVAAE